MLYSIQHTGSLKHLKFYKILSDNVEENNHPSTSSFWYNLSRMFYNIKCKHKY